MVVLFNLLLPIWLLVWIPSLLWLLIIPGNYIIDRLVFTISAKRRDKELEQSFFRKHTWKLFLFGFLSDFVGVILLLIPLFIPVPDSVKGNYNHSFFGKFMNALQSNPCAYFPSFLYTLLAIAVAGALIYFLDLGVLKRTKRFTIEQARVIALSMAVFTAPYLYLVPSYFMWR